MQVPPAGLNIAVVGSGIAGLSAAWLLSRRNTVTLYEAASRAGGHSNTVSIATGNNFTGEISTGEISTGNISTGNISTGHFTTGNIATGDVASGSGRLAVDTGFIVYNETTYPNLSALFVHLGVPTKPSDMSFAVSLDGGQTEYAGTDLFGLFAQPANLLRPRFWSMLRDLRRFYNNAPALVRQTPLDISLGRFLDQHGYGPAFRQDHLLPMAAAIWSASAEQLLDYPAAHFIRFCDNHGLLKFSDRPVWRTVDGGSRVYVEKLLHYISSSRFHGSVRLGRAVTSIRRDLGSVTVRDSDGGEDCYDHVVLGCHADQGLALLDQPTPQETALLGCFRYTTNRAVLHRDPRLMPKRRSVWASWNYLGRREQASELHVTYWMNRLQGLSDPAPVFLTLNPTVEPSSQSVLHEEIYHHPGFDAAAMRAQSRLWSLQGRQRTWFCGAYFGAGFHEDALQSGLAVAEQLGGVRRPWNVLNENGRIHVTTPAPAEAAA